MKIIIRFVTHASLYLLLLLSLSLASCRSIQTTSPTPGQITPEFTRTTRATELTTEAIQATNTQTITPSPTATPQKIIRLNAALPNDLEIINVKNIIQLDLISTIGTPRANEIALSNDGQILAVATDIGVYFYDSLGLYELAFRETQYPVINISFSSDSRRVALGLLGGMIEIYQRENFSFMRHLSVSESSNANLNYFKSYFFRNDTILVSITTTDEEIQIKQWSTKDWQIQHVFSVNTGVASFVNPNIELIGTINKGYLNLQSLIVPEDFKRVKLPDLLSTEFWENFTKHQGDISPSSDGRYLLINNGQSILYWQISSEEIKYQWTDYPTVLPNPCEQAAATCLSNNDEISWYCKEIVTPPIETIAATPDNIMVLVSRNDNIVELRRVSDGVYAWDIETRYTIIRYSPGSEFFFGLRENGLIEKRTTSEGALSGTIDKHTGNLLDIALSPNNNELAAAFKSGGVKIYNLKEGQITDNFEGDFTSLEFSPDGTQLAAGLSDGIVRIFLLEEEQHFDLSSHTDAVNDLKFSEDGSQLITGSDDCAITHWDINKKSRLHFINPDKETPYRIMRVEFSPVDKEQFLVGSTNNLLLVDQTVRIALLPTLLLEDFALSQNNQTLVVTGASTWAFRGIDIEAFSSVIKLSTQGSAVAVSNDGALLIIATQKGLSFWSVSDASEVHTIPYQNYIFPGNEPVSLKISPDNTFIALGYQNGLIGLYGIEGN